MSWSLHFWIYKLLQHYMKCSCVCFTKILFRPCYSRVANIRLSQILEVMVPNILDKTMDISFQVRWKRTDNPKQLGYFSSDVRYVGVSESILLAQTTLFIVPRSKCEDPIYPQTVMELRHRRHISVTSEFQWFAPHALACCTSCVLTIATVTKVGSFEYKLFSTPALQFYIIK